MSVAVSASVEEGRIVAWNLRTRSGTHVGGRDGTTRLTSLQRLLWKAAMALS